MFLYCDHCFIEAELRPEVTILSGMIWLHDPIDRVHYR